ncbi:molybdopterin-dependent oxidoreductase [Actinoplanes utahensis]|nr:molybdopterin-dependent oxidoreductase [Actinoplanes utahensis]GIF35066.1 oxidoreductase [Actinoplanes utahensis]
MRRIMAGAASGILAAGFGVAAAEILAAATRPQAGPLVAVGGAVIDATPTAVKEVAVRELGTYDKPALLGGIVVVLLLFTALTGILGLRRRIVVVAGATLFGAAGAAAALSRPDADVVDTVPSLFGAAITGAILWWLLHRCTPKPTQNNAPTRKSSADSGAVAEAPEPDFNRRSFLRSAALVAGGTATAGASAQWVKRARAGAAARTREALLLPAAASPAVPLPAGTGPGFVTADKDFYRVDTALAIPRINLETWRLRIHGMVDNELELSFDDLLDRPLIERDITLNCVSNEVGGPYIGTARWLGVPLAPLLRQAGLRAGADQLIARSAEGMTIGTPIDVLLDGRDAMLVVGMNGEPLPLVNGFPVRMLTPGLYGYAGACKWLTELRVTTFADVDAYWVERGWATHGTVKTASRIDRPKPFARLTAGTQTIAGVAWAQGRGIAGVEISIDGGDWNAAELLPVPSLDTWAQWRYTWNAQPGPHSIAVRAADRTGAVQAGERATPFPDGATGWHTITVTIA